MRHLFFVAFAMMLLVAGLGHAGGDPPAKIRLDLHGDPLPDGAIQRLGSARVWVGGIQAVALSPDGKTGAIGRDKDVDLWDVTTGKHLRKLEGLRSKILSLTFSPDGKILAAADLGGLVELDDPEAKGASVQKSAIHLWTVAVGNPLRTLASAGNTGPVAFSADGKHLMAADGDLTRWETGTWKKVLVPNVKSVQTLPTEGQISSAASSSNGKMFAVASYGRRVFVVDLATGEVRKIPAEPSNRPFVAISADGKLLATAGGDRLRLWDIATAAEKKLFDASYADQAAFAPQANIVAWIYSMHLYFGDLVTGKMTRPLGGHQSSVDCLAFSGDGKILATGSSDGTILIWDVAGQKLLDPKAVAAAQREGAFAEKSPTVPADARVSIVLAKKEYFLGENIVAQFCVENTGKGLFHIERGGDYRGASRHLRFHVTATDTQGGKVRDPDPSGFCMGGIGHTTTINPGKKECMEVPLLAYCRFDKPGKYIVRISHDFGWHATDDRPLPVAECVLHLVRPTAEQAQKLIDDLVARDKSVHDFYYLRDPIYLPILLKRAEKGDDQALAGIGSIATPEGTQALVRLAGQVPEKFVLGVIQTLNERLPDPQAEGKLPGRNIFLNDRLESRRWLSEQAWRAELAPATRALAQKLLIGKNTDNFKAGAFILECIGQKEDLPALIAALDHALAASSKAPLETWIYPRPRGSCQELVRAATMLNQRFEPSPKLPGTPGEAVIFLNALGTRESFRPPEWEKTVAGLLRHEIPYVRETALNSLPVPLPPAVRKGMPALLLDADVDVQIAACHLAGKSKLPELKEPALKVLATAREDWLVRAVENALWELGARFESIEVLVGRLDDREMTVRCLSRLADWVIADHSTGSTPSDKMFDADQAKVIKARWQRFLQEHGKALRAGNRFPLGDPALTPDLFPHFEFHARQSVPIELRER